MQVNDDAGPTGVSRTYVDRLPMTGHQWHVVGICVLLNMLDGFDILVVAFTGRSIAAEWALSPSQLGLLLSAGLVGMGIGAVGIAPLADRVGRRPVTIACVALAGTGMVLSSVAQSAVQLGVLRVLTGVGVGVVAATTAVLNSEYANDRWRGLAVSLNSTGYALGATLGGILTAALLGGGYGWRAVFLAGGAATLLCVPLVWWRLPESLGFLETRRPRGALERVNAVLARLSRPALAALPEPATAPAARRGGALRLLLGPDMWRNTVLMWAAFALLLAGFYFVTSWTPILLQDAGLSSADALTAGTLLNLGGIFGTALIGLLAARFPVRRVLVSYLTLNAVLLAVFIATTGNLALAFALAAAIGVLINGCIAGLLALTTTVYPAAVRTTGVGTGLAFARIGAVGTPVLTGALIERGWSPEQLYVAFGGVLLVTALLVAALRLARTGPTAAAVPVPARS